MNFKVKNKETGSFVSPRNYYFVINQTGELFTRNDTGKFEKAGDNYEIVNERQEEAENPERLGIADILGIFNKGGFTIKINPHPYLQKRGEAMLLVHPDDMPK